MSDSVPPEYNTAEGLRTLGNYLRSGNGIKVRSGILMEKRIDYFKGKRLVNCILEGKKWPKSLTKIVDPEIAKQVAGLMIKSEFFVRAEKVEDKKGFLKLAEQNVFDENGYYTWIYAGNMMWSNIATVAVMILVIVFTLLPIWPNFAKKILWYASVTFLIGTIAFVLIRFTVFLVLWIAGYEFWIFPRLFDESLSVQDSFKPIYSFDKGTAGQGYYRIGLLVLIVGFIYWAFTQPTEFDGFLKAQKEFIDDIYSGNLLTDYAQETRDNMDRFRNVPNLEDLIKEMEAEAITEKARDDVSNGTEWESNQEGEGVTSREEEEGKSYEEENNFDEDLLNDALIDEMMNKQSMEDDELLKANDNLSDGLN